MLDGLLLFLRNILVLETGMQMTFQSEEDFAGWQLFAYIVPSPTHSTPELCFEGVPRNETYPDQSVTLVLMMRAKFIVHMSSNTNSKLSVTSFILTSVCRKGSFAAESIDLNACNICRRC